MPREIQRQDAGEPDPAMVQVLVDDVRLLVIRRPPTEADFDAHVREAAAVDDRVRVVMVVTDGAGAVPSAKMRAKLRDAGLLKKPTALVSQLSPAIRALLTAFHWLGANLRGFTPDEFQAACDFLQVPADRRADLIEQIALCKERMGAVVAPEPHAQQEEPLARMTGGVESVVAMRVAKIRQRTGNGRGE